MREHEMEVKKVVIIVPFVALNNYVLECIKGCLKLNYSNFQLILLPDEAITLIDELRTERVKIMPTGDVTIAKKRNIAINKFQDTDYYAFIDSDAYPHQEWLRNATKAFLKSNTIGAVGGPNISPHNERLFQKVVGNALKSFSVSGIDAFSKKISKNRFCLKLPTCNLLVAKETIMLCHGFHEDMEIREDCLLCGDIRRSGKKIFFDNTVIVYHQNRFLGRHFLAQRMAYSYYLIKAIRKENSLFNLSFLIPVFFSLFLIIGLFFSFLNPHTMAAWSMVVVLYFLAVIFEAVRYSDKIIEIPLTLAAVLIGNLGYSMGFILSVMGVRINIKKLYKNYKEDTRGYFSTNLQKS
jgi:cellulose synthase/poly-beta-1,6-N-acetylglucosamine synthase-like glycosyltransferase